MNGTKRGINKGLNIYGEMKHIINETPTTTTVIDRHYIECRQQASWSVFHNLSNSQVEHTLFYQHFCSGLLSVPQTILHLRSFILIGQ